MRRVLICAAMVACAAAAPLDLARGWPWHATLVAQQRRAQPPSAPAVRPGVSPAELQQLFDTYAVMQAQQALGLTDAQFAQFISRMKALQAVRRRGENQRSRALQELRRLSQSPDASIDEGLVKERLKALDDLEARSAAEIKEALARVDEILDVRQQVRFRVFEEQMDRNKVELLVRARQANRSRSGL